MFDVFVILVMYAMALIATFLTAVVILHIYKNGDGGHGLFD